jgi:hypothetical protein
MRIGVTLPIGGPEANPTNLSRIGKKAEAFGFHSLWTYDRLLYASDALLCRRGRPEPLRTGYRAADIHSAKQYPRQ